MNRLKTLKQRLCEAEFDIEIQYAVLGLLLIFQAVIPSMKAAVVNRVPVSGPSLCARAILPGDLSATIRVGREVILAENRSGTLFPLEKEFPHSNAAKNFSFRLEVGSTGELCCWLSKLPDFDATCNLVGRPIRVLVFKSSISNQIERAIDSGRVELGSLPPDVAIFEIIPGLATEFCLPEELRNLSP